MMMLTNQCDVNDKSIDDYYDVNMNDLNEFLERLQLEEFTLCNHLFRVALLEGEKHEIYFKHQRRKEPKH